MFNRKITRNYAEIGGQMACLQARANAEMGWTPIRRPVIRVDHATVWSVNRSIIHVGASVQYDGWYIIHRQNPFNHPVKHINQPS